jgi:hypothetical protein
MNEVFSFIDATSLIAKATLWEERDKAIKEKYEKLNNTKLLKKPVAKMLYSKIILACNEPIDTSIHTNS